MTVAETMSLSQILSHSTFPSIVGGDPARSGRYPYLAAFFTDNMFTCGGTLIAPNIVLFAAHCQVLANNSSKFAIGCIDVVNFEGCDVIKIKYSVKHPLALSNGFFAFDLALAILERSSKFKPVKLLQPGIELDVGHEITLLGWGKENKNDALTTAFLREVKVQINDISICNNTITSILAFWSNVSVEDLDIVVVDENNLCLGGSGVGACNGDSGGPALLLCDATEDDVQVGVTSFSIGCAYDGLPSVYQKTYSAEGFSFIKSIVEELGHELRTVKSLEDSCFHSATASPSSFFIPTPFPTLDLSLWTCHPQQYAGADGCHCNCGLYDPDCDFSPSALNCPWNLSSTCSFNGTCINTGEFPTLSPIIPLGWRCDTGDYNMMNGCHCNCGAIDPDCLVDVSNVIGCTSGEICPNGECVKGKPTPAPVIVPSTWTCDFLYFSSQDGCDCNCGGVDPDCTQKNQEIFNCPWDESYICSEGVCQLEATGLSTFPFTAWEYVLFVFAALIAAFFAFVFTTLFR